MLCMLYLRLGTTLLPKLRGEFAFVIYDAKTVGHLPSLCMSGYLSTHQMLQPTRHCMQHEEHEQICCRCGCWQRGTRMAASSWRRRERQTTA